MTFSHRQLVIVGLLATLGCSGGPQPVPASPGGRPEAAVEAFLVAANASDLDRMAAHWGDEDGPSNVTNKIRLEERQQRLAIMQRLLRSDERRLSLSDSTHPTRPVVSAELVQGARRFTVPFTCVRDRRGNWLIREVGLEAAMPRRTGR